MVRSLAALAALLLASLPLPPGNATPTNTCTPPLGSAWSRLREDLGEAYAEAVSDYERAQDSGRVATRAVQGRWRAKRSELEAEARRLLLAGGAEASPRGPRLRPLVIENASNLTLARFQAEYANRRVPVVIKGLHEVVTADKKKTGAGNKEEPIFGASYWQHRCGRSLVQPMRYAGPESRAWGGLEPVSASTRAVAAEEEKEEEEETLAAFINGGDLSETSNGEQRYLADVDLVELCGQGGSVDAIDRLGQEIHVPALFAADFFQALQRGRTETDAGGGPSLFVGGRGTQTGLHRDFAATHFWLLVTEGAKEWVIFEAGEGRGSVQSPAALYHDLPSARRHTFPIDPWALLSERNQGEWLQRVPLSAVLEGWRGSLSAGDLIFVPSGAVHAVRNLKTPTVALSFNYVDETNLQASGSALMRLGSGSGGSGARRNGGMLRWIGTTFSKWASEKARGGEIPIPPGRRALLATTATSAATLMNTSSAAFGIPLWQYKGWDP